jgi:hypothetical protein
MATGSTYLLVSKDILFLLNKFFLLDELILFSINVFKVFKLQYITLFDKLSVTKPNPLTNNFLKNFHSANVNSLLLSQVTCLLLKKKLS